MRLLSRILIAGLIVLFTAGACLGGPNLTIPQPEFDFGFVPQNAMVSHVFWLYSTGDSTLKITKIVPG